MKRTALGLIIVSCLMALLLHSGPSKMNHDCSPAFSAALDRAVGRLEGAVSRAVTAASSVAPGARAGSLDLTTDPYTCDPGDPKCTDLTMDDRPCFTLMEAEPTCDHFSPTCNTDLTCLSAYTCDSRGTCDGSMTCNAEATCWNSTCQDQGQTCDDASATCVPGVVCDFTLDGTHTCNASQTCYGTCASNPTCDATCQGATCEGGSTCEDTCQFTCYDSTCNDTDPKCWVGTMRTSWGKLKKTFK